MTKRPVFIEICRTFKGDWLLLECQWVQKNKHLGVLGTSNSKGFVSREMHHPSVKLVKFFNCIDPLLVNLNKLFDAAHEFVCIEAWHIKMLRRLKETVKVLLSSKCLQCSFPRVLDDAYAFMNRNPVVEHSGRSFELDFSIRDDLWLVPSGFLRVVDR